LSALTTDQLLPPSHVVAIYGYHVPLKLSFGFVSSPVVGAPSVPVGSALFRFGELVARKKTAARLLSPATTDGKTEAIAPPGMPLLRS
jgi:hypothetical protein